MEKYQNQQYRVVGKYTATVDGNRRISAYQVEGLVGHELLKLVPDQLKELCKEGLVINCKASSDGHGGVRFAGIGCKLNDLPILGSDTPEKDNSKKKKNTKNTKAKSKPENKTEAVKQEKNTSENSEGKNKADTKDKNKNNRNNADKQRLKEAQKTKKTKDNNSDSRTTVQRTQKTNNEDVEDTVINVSNSININTKNLTNPFNRPFSTRGSIIRENFGSEIKSNITDKRIEDDKTETGKENIVDNKDKSEQQSKFRNSTWAEMVSKMTPEEIAYDELYVPYDMLKETIESTFYTGGIKTTEWKDSRGRLEKKAESCKDVINKFQLNGTTVIKPRKSNQDDIDYTLIINIDKVIKLRDVTIKIVLTDKNRKNNLGTWKTKAILDTTYKKNINDFCTKMAQNIMNDVYRR